MSCDGALSFDVNVELHRGGRRLVAEFAAQSRLVALFGPSGAGKTSLLNMIAGLVRPDRGRIAIGGDVLFDSTAGIDLAPERRACGYVLQDGRLFPHRRVKDNLLYGWKFAPPERRSLALDTVVGLLGIGHLLGRMPGTLSGGEAQRVALGRALLSGPRFLLMDEPLSSLDMARRDEIMPLIERIRDELRIPILYVSHDRTEIDRLAHDVVQLG